MEKNFLNLEDYKKNIYSNHINWKGKDINNNTLSINNYFINCNEEPYFGIIGEFHFSRYTEDRWEDEILKMKMCGINIISTYIFWIHHEEIRGVFDWKGNKNLRKFINLCKKNNVYSAVRIGPFNHGEVRNGGMPDWIFNYPFEIRSNDEGYLIYVKRLYREISNQLEGLYYKDGGPILIVQIENEYMHAGAPLESSVGTSNQWISKGRDGDSHILKLKEIAKSYGIDVPIYTCTGWGKASSPEIEVLALWGGYSFRPWIFYDDVKEHPPTKEYLFQDYHNNKVKSYNYEPLYDEEKFPYACCEMGGGMQSFYNYRFKLPFNSVDAMSVIKIAGGCNMLGYYMFHGGSNPKSKKGTFLNEYSIPKISYDYQAPIGEFGQIRESYKRLKRVHYFLRTFEKLLCPMKTFIPKNAEFIEPHDIKTLRYGVRANKDSGFLFVNNYQDHLKMLDKKNIKFSFKLANKEFINIPECNDKEEGINIRNGQNIIIPFNINIDGVKLIYTTNQLITKIYEEDEVYYFFFNSEGIKSEYCFDNDTAEFINIGCNYRVNLNNKSVIKSLKKIDLIKLRNKRGKHINIVTLTEEESLNFWVINVKGKKKALITNASLIQNENNIKLEFADNNIKFKIFPHCEVKKVIGNIKYKGKKGIFSKYNFNLKREEIFYSLKKIVPYKTIVDINYDKLNDVKDIILKIKYTGDIGELYANGELIHDNFNNGEYWEIGLKRFMEVIEGDKLCIKIIPLKKDNTIKSDSPMAARYEDSKDEIGDFKEFRLDIVYEVSFNIK